jgi:hypothetical protein
MNEAVQEHLQSLNAIVDTALEDIEPAIRKDIIKADTVNQKAKTDNAGKIAVAKITAKKQSQTKKSSK